MLAPRAGPAPARGRHRRPRRYRGPVGGAGSEEEDPGGPQHWFGKTDGGLGFGPLTWQGRAATALYVFLVIVAVFVYSQISLTVLVVVFYTLTFGFVVALKSDLLKHWPPRS